MIWFTSDLHLSHGNIIIYCNRPFNSVEEMNKIIIRNWNERVKDEDTVFFLGDFCFKRSKEAPESRGSDIFDYYRKQLKGNIIFIEGNHDNRNNVKTSIQSIVIKLGGKFIKLVHRPEYAEGKYDINLVGHVHEKWQIQQKVMKGHRTTLFNVGVDVNKFRPVNINEIMASINKWKRENNV